MSIYQALLKYLQNHKLAETSNRKVWDFMGDGETDEPESLGAISLAGREKLDNLIFVINCNLQRLYRPTARSSRSSRAFSAAPTLDSKRTRTGSALDFIENAKYVPPPLA
jgi:pyruvate dehydrogenase complex dehydrogenase (E1) component